MITKSDTIAEIMRINPTVNSAFLAEFGANELTEYLHRLKGLGEPRFSHQTVSFPNAAQRQTELVAGAA